MIRSMEDLENVRILVVTSKREVKAKPQAAALEDCVDANDTVFLYDGHDLVLCSMIEQELKEAEPVRQLEELDPSTSADIWAETVEANPWVSVWADDPKHNPPESI